MIFSGVFIILFEYYGIVTTYFLLILQHALEFGC